MSVILEIDFFNPLDEKVALYSLKWEVATNEAAVVWLSCLYHSLKKDQSFSARFNGFSQSPRDLSFLSRKMNEAIDIINYEGKYPRINERADGRFTQEFANIMHHHFELLYGDAKNPSDYFLESSAVGRSAISAINHCVHDMEAFARAQQDHHSSRAVVFEVLHRQQFKLPDGMKKDFKLDLNFGDICLHYGLVGKTWWEVFLDKDEEIFEEGIRPLDVIGPEFDIHFHTDPIAQDLKSEFFEFLKEKGQDPYDSNLCLGFLPVAHLVEEGASGNSKEHMIEQVGMRCGVKSIRLIKDNKLWIEKDFQDDHLMQEGFLKLNPLYEVGDGDSIVTHGFPTEAFVLSGKKEGVVIGPTITKGKMITQGHAVAFYVPQDGKSIVLPVSEENRGFLWNEDHTILPGQYICLLYDGHNSYSPHVKDIYSPVNKHRAHLGKSKSKPPTKASSGKS